MLYIIHVILKQKIYGTLHYVYRYDIKWYIFPTTRVSAKRSLSRAGGHDPDSPPMRLTPHLLITFGKLLVSVAKMASFGRKG